LVLLLGVLSASAFSLLGTGATKAPARNGNRNRDDFPAWKDENLILFAKPKKGKSTQNLEEGDDWTQKVLTEVQVQLDANNINEAIERINKAQSELPEGTLLSPEVFAPVIYHAREALDFSLARGADGAPAGGVLPRRLPGGGQPGQPHEPGPHAPRDGLLPRALHALPGRAAAERGHLPVAAGAGGQGRPLGRRRP
ncbi:unnamed protein product, partial [Heterosigma akashiwo]